ncbi:MAG: DUF1622 domain-containing protein [Anaerolineales bacterium]|jgi:uncharacterized membrane protein
MLRDVIASVGGGEVILEWVEYAALAIEILAVVIIIFAIFYNVIRYSFRGFFNADDDDRYRDLKVGLGKALLLSLEILVAADIVRTVALEATFMSVLVLGMLVAIRTFLSWALIVEVEGRWPWQRPLDN